MSDKLPAIQWYTRDWRTNVKLRLCSWAARGAWSDCMCLMHDNAEEYGVLRVPLRKIAEAIGCPFSLLRELASQRVIKGSDSRLEEAYVYRPKHARGQGDPVVLIPAQDGPIWYSSRMVRDAYARKVKGVSTRFQPGGGSDTGRTMPRQGERQGEGNTARQGDGSAVAVAVALKTLSGGAVDKSVDNASDSGHGGGKEVSRNGKGNSTGRAWMASEAATRAMARSLGLGDANAGESWDDYRRRIERTIEQRRREAH